jgi:hypothetical protein
MEQESTSELDMVTTHRTLRLENLDLSQIRNIPLQMKMNEDILNRRIRDYCISLLTVILPLGHDILLGFLVYFGVVQSVARKKRGRHTQKSSKIK